MIANYFNAFSGYEAKVQNLLLCHPTSAFGVEHDGNRPRTSIWVTGVIVPVILAKPYTDIRSKVHVRGRS